MVDRSGGWKLKLVGTDFPVKQLVPTFTASNSYLPNSLNH